jgi:hypothetical protein
LETKQVKKNLLIVPSGADPMWQHWKDYDQYNFDLAILQWSDTELANTAGAVYHEREPGMKWRLVGNFMKKYDLSGYEYIACYDDDCITGPDVVAAAFDFCKEHQLDIAQQAQGPGGYYTHESLKQIDDAILHTVNMVEVMCPIFSQRCWPEASVIFDQLPIGFGMNLERYWRHIFESEEGVTKYGSRVAVIDILTFVHGRPVSSGSDLKARGIDPFVDGLFVEARGHHGDKFEIIETVYKEGVSNV